MDEKPNATGDSQNALLKTLGARLRAQRKALHLNATVTAEAAGVSRVTLHRIEKGEASVAMGAWCNTAVALGMTLQVLHAQEGENDGKPADRTGWIPARIALEDYPQLRSLAWQVHGTSTLRPTEAFDIYERNARHLDQQAMSAEEKTLLESLRLAFSLGNGTQEAAHHAV